MLGDFKLFLTSSVFRKDGVVVSKIRNSVSKVIQIRRFGQPAAQTHPHLLSHDDVTPGVTKQHYKTRRHKLMQAVLDRHIRKNLTCDNHIVVIPSAAVKYMTHDIPYVFRQHTDFLYLCGFQEPDSVLVLTGDMHVLPGHTATLFVRPKDPYKELWEGERSGKQGAIELTGVDNAESIDSLPKFLESYMKKRSNTSVWYSRSNNEHMSVHTEQISNFITNAKPASVENVDNVMQEMRLIKSVEEVKLMQKSNDIAGAAFQDVMRLSHGGVDEAHLWAKMDFECRVRGAEFLAYPPVVAGGNRANTIHYIKNNQIVRDGELVLMDAGCEYHGYASDITRTWPVSGRFSEPQRELYEALLEVQQQCVELCAHHDMNLRRMFEEMLVLLAHQAQRIRLIPPHVTGKELLRTVRELCPHHVGHYLGMDVHDTDNIARTRTLRPGMVITVEPGIYVPKNRPGVPEWFRGNGLRIEDNVLIVEDGYHNFTNCPKKVAEIERICSTAR